MQLIKSRFRKDHLGGLLAVVGGLSAAYQGSTYDIGSLEHMGPGFFPTALGILLAICGLAIGFSGETASAELGKEHASKPINWRAWGCIIAAVASFVVLGQHAGLGPATFAIVFIAALGDRGNTLKSAAVLGVVATAICVIVFWWALKIQLPLFALS